MNIAVIMRTRNSEKTLPQALRALYSQTRQDFTLHVVDSGSTDRTLEIVANYPAVVRHIESSSYYPGKVLNTAIQGTDADLLVFHNSCAVALVPQALDRLLAPFENARVCATFARQVPSRDAETWVRRDYQVSFPAHGPAPSWLPYSLPLAAMRRSAWEEHPFYTDAWGSEDVEWGYWAQRNGRQVAYVADAVVMHSHNYNPRELYARRFIEGEADAFIHGGSDTLAGFLKRTTGAIARDVVAYLRAGDILGIPRIPLLRLAFHWGYYRGRCWGALRARTRNTDTGRGQSLALQNRPQK